MANVASGSPAKVDKNVAFGFTIDPRSTENYALKNCI
jgi:hypothetical protein